MSDQVELESATLAQRVVLLGVVDLSLDGETPAHAGEIRATCNDAIDAVEGEIVGRLSEAEVTRSLNEIEAEGPVEATRSDTSPTGKGRPKYRLTVTSESVLDELETDDRVEGLLSRVDSA